MSDLTQAEEALYDRQLRVWGKEAQNRLRTSRIFLYNLNGVGMEVAKNIILAGVGSVTILDDHVMTVRDLGINFMSGPNAIGKLRVEEALPGLTALNPHVKVTPIATSLDEQDENFFKNFDVICLCGATLQQQLRINTIAREQSTQIPSHTINVLTGDCLGHVAYFFEDLQQFTYKVEVKVNPPPAIALNKKRKAPDSDNKPDVEEKKTELRHVSFPTLTALTSVQYSDIKKVYKKRITEAKLCGFVLLVLHFQALHGHFPGKTAEDEKLLSDVATERHMSEVLDDDTIQSLLGTLHAQASAVCAITGGFLGQEVVKVITRKSEPLNNTMVYDSRTGRAIVKTLGAVESSSSSSASKIAKSNSQAEIILL